MYVDLPELEALRLGATVLGSGGGGDTYLSYLLAREAVKKKGPVRLLQVHELPDDALVIPTAMMGSPMIMNERVPSGKEALSSLRTVEKQLGLQALATMPIEVGGLNAFTALTAAAWGSLPVVDGDGMGRAFPELQMCTFHVYKVAGSPVAVTSEQGHSVVIESAENPMLERLARATVAGMGGVGYIAAYPMRGKQVKEASVAGTLSLGIRIGQELLSAERKRSHPAGALLDTFAQSTYGQGMVLLEGRVTGLERQRAKRVTVEGHESYARQTLEVEFRYENLIARLDGRVVSTVPELIVFLHYETGMPLLTEELRPGMRVICLSVPTPEITITDEALAVFGPRAFGYSCEFRSVKEDCWR